MSKTKFTIILAYATLFLWIWLGVELSSTELQEPIRSVPMWGFIVTAWVIVRLEMHERKAKAERVESKS